MNELTVIRHRVLAPIAGGAVSAKWYGQAIGKLLAKTIDLTSDDIRVALLKNTYTPDQDAHVFWSDVSAGTNEVTGTGYTANGVALTSKALTYDSATNKTTFGAANVSWTSATFTARYAVYYDRTPSTDATRPLLVYVDFGADVPVSVGSLLLDLSAGIATVTPA